jgi:hypothetical protein
MKIWNRERYELSIYYYRNCASVKLLRLKVTRSRIRKEQARVAVTQSFIRYEVLYNGLRIT